MCLWNKALEFLLRMSSVFLKRYFKGIIFLVLSSLNKLDTATKGTKWFSNPQALSSTLAMFRTLQPWAFGLLNRLVTLILASNYYGIFLLFSHCLCKLLLLCFQGTAGAHTTHCLYLHLGTMATVITTIRRGHHGNRRLVNINSNITNT